MYGSGSTGCQGLCLIGSGSFLPAHVRGTQNSGLDTPSCVNYIHLHKLKEWTQRHKVQQK
jgi:hypothetical protein